MGAALYLAVVVTRQKIFALVVFMLISVHYLWDYLRSLDGIISLTLVEIYKDRLRYTHNNHVCMQSYMKKNTVTIELYIHSVVTPLYWLLHGITCIGQYSA